MTQRNGLEERVRDRWKKKTGGLRIPDYVRAELDRLARQVREIRREVNSPTCQIDAGYKTALTEVLALLREAKK